jgi:mannose-6-phosphate isomerase-like protein (cupin superfamily)
MTRSIFRFISAVSFMMLLAVAARAQSSQATQTGGVIHIDHIKVDEAFKKGEVLLVKDNYRIHAGFRDKTGVPEVHAYDVDIFYVTEGTASFVIGGSVVEPATIEPGETRGKEIKGGETRKLVKGDVIVIPPNVPHWFKEVSGTFKYFVVKVRK